VFFEDIASTQTKILKSQHCLCKFTMHRHYVLTVEKHLFNFGRSSWYERGISCRSTMLRSNNCVPCNSTAWVRVASGEKKEQIKKKPK